MCIFAVGCSHHRPLDVLCAVGDEVQMVVIADVGKFVRDANETSSVLADSFPELAALGRLRGVDFRRAAAVSYTPDMSAVILSITAPKVLKGRLGDSVAEDSIGRVYRIVDNTYFVADTAWLWMVDSDTGPYGALEKVNRFRHASAIPLSDWKIRKLDDGHDIVFMCPARDNLCLGRIDYDRASVDFHAVCFDNSGGLTPWLPLEGWPNLQGPMARIDPRNRLAVAFSRTNIASLKQFLPKKLRRASFFDEFSGMEYIPQFNLALNSPNQFRLTADTEDMVDAENIADKIKTLLGVLPQCNIHTNDSVLNIESTTGAPQLTGTSYAGSHIAVSINLPEPELKKFAGISADRLSAIAVVGDATFDGRIDLIGCESPIISCLFKLMLGDEQN